MLDSDAKLPYNQESTTYGMKLSGPIFITESQKDVMRILYKDPQLSNREIGLRLGKKRNAIGTLMVDLYYRTGAKSRGELVALAHLMEVKEQRGGDRRAIIQAYRDGKAY